MDYCLPENGSAFCIWVPDWLMCFFDFHHRQSQQQIAFTEKDSTDKEAVLFSCLLCDETAFQAVMEADDELLSCVWVWIQ